MIRTGLLILSGNAAASFVLLVRNLLVARLVPVADYGIAATFAIVVALLEMASALGLQQQIVQSRKGDDPDFQAALQGFQLLRGVVSGIALLILAEPAAQFMNLPEVAWAYRVLAVIPVLNALQHFDIHRFNREMRFGPMLATSIVPAVASLLLVWPLAAVFGDYRVMLWALVAQAVLMALLSHLVAARRWRLRVDARVMAGALHFGWPLLINNVMLFAVFNGDRVIVARELGPVLLGLFSMGVTLTLTPTLVLAKSTQNFFLPQLSRLRAAQGADAAPEARLAQLSHAALQAPLLAGAVFVVTVALLGQPAVHAVLGEKYAPLLPFLTWLALVQALRVAKAGPNIVALSAGHTSNAMLANALRLSVLPAAWYVATTSADLMTIVRFAAAGELAGYALALALVRRRLALPLGPLALPLVALAALYAATVGLDALDRPAARDAAWLALPPLLLLVALSMRDLRRYLSARQVPGAPA